jgi:hypothetical protein
MNRTRKSGGSINFSNYTPEEIHKMMNNYLGAAYSMKVAGNTLKNSIMINTTQSYINQTDNAVKFNRITLLYSAYVKYIKELLSGIRPSPIAVPPPL